MRAAGVFLTTACVGRAADPNYCSGDSRYWSHEKRRTCCWIAGRGCLDDRGNVADDFAYDHNRVPDSGYRRPYRSDDSEFQDYRPRHERHYGAPSPPAPLPPWPEAHVVGSGHGVYSGDSPNNRNGNGNFGDWFHDADEQTSHSFWPPRDHREPRDHRDEAWRRDEQWRMPAEQAPHAGAPQAVERFPESCKPRFLPPAPPLHSTDLNGVALPDACFGDSHAPGPHHVFVIGDWGGVHIPPKPADHRSPKFPHNQRRFVHGVDDCAQQRVAAQMKERAKWANPDYVLNVGDNFYWGGINAQCGSPPFKTDDHTGQWKWIYEEIYKGPGLDNKQWLGILGNHDFGGYFFTSAWDQVIGYTWFNGGTHRWMTPALYWSVKVRYPEFSVDYLFADSNNIDAMQPASDEEHNICSQKHNNPRATCGPQGPESINACPGWFDKLWKDEVKWMNKVLDRSTSNWQIIITHYPPNFGNQETWLSMSNMHGVDLFITGHVHRQEVHYRNTAFGDTAFIISGGGGGITSEGVPSENGDDDQYGFMDLTLTREHIFIQAISHGGRVRSNTTVFPRGRRGGHPPTRLV